MSNYLKNIYRSMIGMKNSLIKKFFSAMLLILCIFILRYINNSLWTVQRRNILYENIKTLRIVKPSEDDMNFKNVIDEWRFIGDPQKRQKIFSAYFDPRLLEPLVQLGEDDLQYGSIRIFAVLTLYKNENIYCVYRYTSGAMRIVKAYESLPVHEHFDMEFSAYIIACSLSHRKEIRTVPLPASVAIAYKSDETTFNNPTYVSIRYAKGNLFSEPNEKLAACVGPIQKNYSEALRIVEFIEIYQLLGVEKFYLYNLSATADVQKIVQYYKDRGIVELINWNFYGYKFENEVRYNGILVAINECMYRATFIDNYKYVAVVDFDEILITFKHNTLLSYVMDVMKKNTENHISAFIFRGAFIHKHFASDYLDIPKDVKIKFLYTQTKVERLLIPYKAHSRSKYIANARSIIETGSHEIWRSLENYKEYVVPVEDGLLFHYRTECVEGKTCDGPLIVDFSARRFGSLLWKYVDNVCANIFQNATCPQSDWMHN